MNNIYKITTTLAAALLILAACAKKDTTVRVSGVSLDNTTVVMNIGESRTLVATVLPENAENKDVTWTSSAPETVSVDQNGEISALLEGTADITVTTVDGGHQAVCKVAVTDPVIHPKSIKIFGVVENENGVQSEVELDEIELLGTGAQKPVRVAVLPEGASQETGWTVSDGTKVIINRISDLGSVSGLYMFTAINPGTATVTAVSKEDETVQKTCTVTVKKIY